MKHCRRTTQECIIIGDLNVKSSQWGSPVTDARGTYFADWLPALDLVVHNSDHKPNFVRGESGSYVDVTCATQKLGKADIGQTVSDDKGLSDHPYIYFELNRESERTRTERQKD